MQKERENKKKEAFDQKENMDILIQAIKNDDKNLYEYALSVDPMLPHYIYNGMNYPIHVACEFGRLNMVKHMVEELQVDFDIVCKVTGYTPLMYACQSAQSEVVEYLSSSRIGGRLETKSVAVDQHGQGRTALDILVESQQLGPAENMKRMLEIRQSE